jgi:hypothetical protein
VVASVPIGAIIEISPKVGDGESRVSVEFNRGMKVSPSKNSVYRREAGKQSEIGRTKMSW